MPLEREEVRRSSQGSGSTWPDLDGDPDVVVGAIVLVGAHRYTLGARNASVAGEHPIGQVRRVEEDYGAARPSKIHYVGVRHATSDKLVWARVRDCVCLVRANGELTPEGGLVKLLETVPTARLFRDPAARGHAVVAWALRAGLLTKRPEGLLIAVTERVRAVQLGIEAVRRVISGPDMPVKTVKLLGETRVQEDYLRSRSSHSLVDLELARRFDGRYDSRPGFAPYRPGITEQCGKTLELPASPLPVGTNVGYDYKALELRVAAQMSEEQQEQSIGRMQRGSPEPVEVREISVEEVDADIERRRERIFTPIDFSQMEARLATMLDACSQGKLPSVRRYYVKEASKKVKWMRKQLERGLLEQRERNALETLWHILSPADCCADQFILWNALAVVGWAQNRWHYEVRRENAMTAAHDELYRTVLAQVQYEKDTGENVFARGAQPGEKPAGEPAEPTATAKPYGQWAHTVRRAGAGEAAVIDALANGVPVESKTVKPAGTITTTPPAAAPIIRGLFEQMERSRYVGPPPQSVARAMAMFTLAACRTSLTDNERIVVEDWASTRGFGSSCLSREADWSNARRGFDWLYKTFSPRWVIDGRVQAALEEQLHWLAAQDPTAAQTSLSKDGSGERERAKLDEWLRSPLGQPVGRR